MSRRWGNFPPMSNDSPIRSRIRRYLSEPGRSAAALSKAAGLNEQFVSQFLRGKSQSARGDNLEALAEAMGLSIAELMAPLDTDGGEPGEAIARGATPASDGIEFQGMAYAALPVFDVRASAGPGALNSDHPQPESWLLFALEALRMVTRAPVPDLAMIRVSGDSMFPTLCHEDMILVDRSVRVMGRDGLYVIASGPDVQVKRLTRNWADQTLTVGSDNPLHENSQGVREDTLPILGRVVWLSRNVGG